MSVITLEQHKEIKKTAIAEALSWVGPLLLLTGIAIGGSLSSYFFTNKIEQICTDADIATEKAEASRQLYINARKELKCIQ